MNTTEYMVQAATDFNSRVDDTQEMIEGLNERMMKLEYNIERLEHSINLLTDMLPLALPKHKKGDDTTYEKYIKRT